MLLSCYYIYRADYMLLEGFSEVALKLKRQGCKQENKLYDRFILLGRLMLIRFDLC